MRPQTTFARRCRRLKLTTAAAARILGVPQATAENWRQGRNAAPRPALRLLALWGRLQRRTQAQTRSAT